MTGRDDELLPEGVPAFDDPAYDGLRAALAGLEPVGPMPADVAARLDEVLAGLGGTPVAAAPEPAAVEPEPLLDNPVVPLRRRTNAGRRLLVAAAAVVAIGGGGIGLANVAQQNKSGDADSGSVAAADSAEVPEAAAGGEGTARDGDAQTPTSGYSGTSGVPRLSTARFAADAEQVLGTDFALTQALRRVERTAPNKSDSPAVPDSSATPELSSPGTTADNFSGEDTEQNLDALKDAVGNCATDRITGGVARPVLLDGEPAILVVYPEVSGTRVVQARSCDANTVLISATVPVG